MILNIFKLLTFTLFTDETTLYCSSNKLEQLLNTKWKSNETDAIKEPDESFKDIYYK